MRAAFYDQMGAAREVLRIGDIPDAVPGRGEVLVRVKVSGVNPSDVKSRSGRATFSFPRVIPHSDGAGIIESVGVGVDPARVGQRVWIWNAQWGRPFGTAAELVALPVEQAVHLPDNIPFEVGACLGVPFLTAWHAVNYRPVTQGETFLVTGGAGSVGFYAIQLAKRAGARVITTVSSDEKGSVARDAGADMVVNYQNEDIGAVISSFTNGAGVDRIVEVDLVGNASLYPKLLRRNGLAVVYGSRNWSAPLPLADWLVHGVELAIFIVYELASRVRSEAVIQSDSILADPTFQHRIAARYPLDRIVDAHEAVESGRLLGNVVVRVG